MTFATLPIYTGGRITNGIIAARSQQNVQQSEVFQTVLDLKVTVAEAYIGVLRGRRNLEVARSNVARLQSFATDVQNRKREGLATRNDELSAEVSLANARLGEIQARTALEIAWATYNRYLDRPSTTYVGLEELSDQPTDLDLEAPGEARPCGAARSWPGRARARCKPDRPGAPGPARAGRAHRAGAALEPRPSDRAGVRPQASFVGAFLYLGNNRSIPQGLGSATFLLDWTIVDAPDPPAGRRR